MLKWKCLICGNDADYHLGEKDNHKYFCGKHWWEYVQKGHMVSDMDNINGRMAATKEIC